MAQWQRISTLDQFTAHLRAELLSGKWVGAMPGVHRLAAECGLNPKTVEAALKLLEQEGLLEGQGPGRKRKIMLAAGRKTLASLRIAILPYNIHTRQLDYMIKLKHKLTKEGHEVFFSAKSLIELGMDVPRIRRMVKAVEVDAWVVGAASHQVLEWFSKQSAPVFALFGRLDGLPIAGTKPDKAVPLADATRQLIGLGHRRISMLTQSARRLPEPGRLESLFLEELESHGIPTSSYNLPDWDDTTEGFHQALDALFATTPPTALILAEPQLLFAAQQFLQGRQLRVPEDVSLICTDDSPYFSLSKPSIAHINWDSRPVVSRVVNWTSNISRGKKDIRQKLTPAELVEGGTIGPAR